MVEDRGKLNTMVLVSLLCQKSTNSGVRTEQHPCLAVRCIIENTIVGVLNVLWLLVVADYLLCQLCAVLLHASSI